MPEFEGFRLDVNFLRFPGIEPRRWVGVRFDAWLQELSIEYERGVSAR